ncbi:hypothetical protein IEQ34_025559 [Dendrobium chrysotoxum]|uniref:Uncharacterized protein n=1 Tax=Dendrobium chrysotoxum TaxID=161865 RepID=A0AAV7FNX1_DENCH|nr:hypothetical protein IEQ34_025966 [Dendrobium chrysotoxum]KAH0440536.1 hypothetical protein IEQ34_025559 [Dendrobium chrysotoxum]
MEDFRIEDVKQILGTLQKHFAINLPKKKKRPKVRDFSIGKVAPIPNQRATAVPIKKTVVATGRRNGFWNLLTFSKKGTESYWHACDNFDCPIAKLVPRMRFYRHAMPTIKQLLRNARQPIRNVTKSPALRGCPQRRGTCTRDRKEKGSEIGDMLRRIVSQIFFISSHFISSQINTRIQSGLKQDEKKRNAKASLDGDSDPETEPASS